jgi:D-alanine-D-alanine ligase
MSGQIFHRVAVLKGGPSAEREVSLASGAAVAQALRRKGYEVEEIDVTAAALSIPRGIEAVFIALHGTFGEDGGVQAILEGAGIPFTGSGSASSRLSFDKVASKKSFERQAINTPRYEVLRAGQPRTLPLPVVTKPPRQGSSIGVSVVREEKDWAQAAEAALATDGEMLVEAYVEGRELTVGVVGEQVLPVVEIRAPHGYYDYGAKYTKGRTEYLVPAPIDEEAARQCRELAWRSFVALGCRGMGRVDIRLCEDGVPFVLELNSIPGFTETSLLPKAARSAGIEFDDLCERILNMAAAK